MSTAQPLFFYDLSSPYAYLAAVRIDVVLPAPPRWVPVVFGAILAHAQRTPWSLQDDLRLTGQLEVARRAHERGLPEVRWPQGWPAESYSVTPLRALVWAAEQGADIAKALALKLYEVEFVDGRALADIELVIAAAASLGLDGNDLRAGVQRPEIKAALRANTDDAIARGVVGVPTVAVGKELYWGDDRLEDAAGALAG